MPIFGFFQAAYLYDSAEDFITGQAQEDRCAVTSDPDQQKLPKDSLGCTVFQCPQCRVVFNQEKNWLLHKTTCIKRKKKKMCAVCARWFNCDSELRRHLTTHTGEKLYSCGICGQKFTRRDSLRRHILIQGHRS